jgi:CRP/FNR family transcriptional regulator, cyclic AMP receptor protein
MTNLDDAPNRSIDLDILATTPPQSIAYKRGRTIFTHGEPSDTVMRVANGLIRLSVFSPAGKEAVVTIVHAGDYFGEACLNGERQRRRTAVAITDCTVIVTERHAMASALQADVEFADRFLRLMLLRNMRIENDLVDQLVNATEKRVARALLLLARYSAAEEPATAFPMVSQSTLAAMVGTTRSRVNFFVNKFRRLGVIELDHGLKINRALLNAVLRD